MWGLKFESRGTWRSSLGALPYHLWQKAPGTDAGGEHDAVWLDSLGGLSRCVCVSLLSLASPMSQPDSTWRCHMGKTHLGMVTEASQNAQVYGTQKVTQLFSGRAGVSPLLSLTRSLSSRKCQYINCDPKRMIEFWQESREQGTHITLDRWPNHKGSQCLLPEVYNQDRHFDVDGRQNRLKAFLI